MQKVWGSIVLTNELERLLDMMTEQRRHWPCKNEFVRSCGCGIVHDHMAVCTYHREVLLSDSNLRFMRQ